MSAILMVIAPVDVSAVLLSIWKFRSLELVVGTGLLLSELALRAMVEVPDDPEPACISTVPPLEPEFKVIAPDDTVIVAELPRAGPMSSGLTITAAPLVTFWLKLLSNVIEIPEVMSNVLPLPGLIPVPFATAVPLAVNRPGVPP